MLEGGGSAKYGDVVSVLNDLAVRVYEFVNFARVDGVECGTEDAALGDPFVAVVRL